MDKIRMLFLIAGIVLFGAGMIWAGLLNIFRQQLTAGVAYIVVAVVISSLCVFAFLHGKKHKR